MHLLIDSAVRFPDSKPFVNSFYQACIIKLPLELERKTIWRLVSSPPKISISGQMNKWEHLYLYRWFYRFLKNVTWQIKTYKLPLVPQEMVQNSISHSQDLVPQLSNKRLSCMLFQKGQETAFFDAAPFE